MESNLRGAGSLEGSLVNQGARWGCHFHARIAWKTGGRKGAKTDTRRSDSTLKPLIRLPRRGRADNSCPRCPSASVC